MAGKLQHPTALAIHLRDDGVMGGCEQYRIRIPFEQIRKRVPDSIMDWAPMGKVRQWAGSAKEVKPTDYDMWLLPRHRPLPYGVDGTLEYEDIPTPLRNSLEGKGILQGKAHLLDMVRLAKEKQCIVLEYDDDHWGARDLGYMEYVDLAIELLSLADAITVTTPYMRKTVQRYAPGVPVYILPNCVVFDEWQGLDRWSRWPKDYVVLALTGSITHYEDWKVLENVLPRVMKENGNVALILQGFIPDYFEHLPYRFPHRVYADKMFRDYPEYPGIIRQADIVLCPVDPEDRFNLAKSGIKAVEGFAAGRPLSNGRTGGAAVIASPLPYYRRVVGNRSVVTNHTPEAWYEAITLMVRDADRREDAQAKGRKWVYKNRSIERQWGLWWNAYREIHRRKR